MGHTGDITLDHYVEKHGIQAYPDYRRAKEGRERCQVRLFGEALLNSAKCRVAAVEEPMGRYRRQAEECESLAMDAEAEAARAEMPRLVREPFATREELQAMMERQQ